jgi:protease-4
MKTFFKTIAKFAVRILATVGALTLLLLFIGIGLVANLDSSAQPVPDQVVLEIDFGKGLVEYVPDDPIAQALSLADKPTTVRDVVLGLKRAAADERVLGLVAKTGAAPLGLAVIQEVRDAVLDFRAGGKFAVAYAETFGEFGPGNGAYYLSTAFDEIYLLPSGDLNLTGLMYESPFLRGALSKLDIKVRAGQRKEYKNMANVFTEDKYNAPHREAIEALMNSQFAQITAGISTARTIASSELEAWIDRAPLSAAAALDANLVDQLLYRDQVFDQIKERTNGAPLLYLSKYLERAGGPYDEGRHIALIYGVGQVQRGGSDYNGLSGSSSMGSSSIARAFRRAVADGAEAIVFRVDSPGGSYVASDIIWREIGRTRQQGVPVIATMGNVAASGGYFVSMPADKVVAQPGTITGSIGVVLIKLLTEKFWKEHFGVTWDEVHTSANATLWTNTRDYSSDQWKHVQASLDRIYDDFTAKAAQGRGLEAAAMDEVAKGRVWTGADAQERQLVDALGGFETALVLARSAADIAADEPIHLIVYPRPKKLIELVLELDQEPENSESESYISTSFSALQDLRSFYRAVGQLGVFAERDILRSPHMDIKW